MPKVFEIASDRRCPCPLFGRAPELPSLLSSFAFAPPASLNGTSTATRLFLTAKSLSLVIGAPSFFGGGPRSTFPTTERASLFFTPAFWIRGRSFPGFLFFLMLVVSPCPSVDLFTSFLLREPVPDVFSRCCSFPLFLSPQVPVSDPWPFPDVFLMWGRNQFQPPAHSLSTQKQSPSIPFQKMSRTRTTKLLLSIDTIFRGLLCVSPNNNARSLPAFFSAGDPPYILWFLT